ncbi:hypothetical protein PFICI_03970 [Pestalotiopsis fici W106-1]|uniref:Heterokaryon incompatibility domain-containing protein n=1 Tax=Pestalotiopsis fici (strain W106-1 / CGMCC3.15140) TaxID=1229662 RepID=W3XIU9_PESFW|nr:uncharacterized protein PFICI_03970 [Pestalotiopsis fici W106-1]ETS85945.1 hypothetical protein PFICI_03970 [Pestalotiopsis fici W106-1]
MERPYVYQALALPHNVRLLRLSPNAEDSAPLYGHLIECDIKDFYGQPDSFEALSYVWGAPESYYSISLDGFDLPITTNLYVALKNLRHRHRDRLLWVDAMCINQTDDREKERQIGLMYQIYACASCVVVWLGENEDGSEYVFEDLRTIKQKMLANDKEDKPSAQRLVKFFQRAWFRRVWVLQEVGAARQIQIRCGRSLMDGYAFSMAANRVNLWLQTQDRGQSQELHETIQDVAYLIQGSIFRPPYHGPGTLPEGMGHFKQMIDLFHSREATKIHDKIFALLGMSSNDMSTSGLLPDYTIPFKHLFERLVKFVISDRLLVECQQDRPLAVIKATGWMSETAMALFGHLPCFLFQGNIEMRQAFTTNDPNWTLPTSSKPVQKDDLICLFDGTATPTIIRPYGDVSVIVVAAPLLCHNMKKVKLSTNEWIKRGESGRLSSRHFLLIWDWNYSSKSYAHLKNYQSWSALNKWVSRDSKSPTEEELNSLIQRCDHTLLASDGNGDSPQVLKEILMHFETVLRIEDSYIAVDRKLTEFLFGILNSSAHTEFQCSSCTSLHDITFSLLVWALDVPLGKVARRIYEFHRSHTINSYCSDTILRSKLDVIYGRGDVEMIEWVIEEGADVNRPAFGIMARTALQAAAEQGYMNNVECLLRAGADVNAPPVRTRGRTALQAAAEQGHIAITERLLQANAQINAEPAVIGGITALEAAVISGNVSLVEILLERGAWPNTKDVHGNTPLILASKKGHTAVVEALLASNADIDARNRRRETALYWARKNDHVAIVAALRAAKRSVKTGNVLGGIALTMVSKVSTAAQRKRAVTDLA